MMVNKEPCLLQARAIDALSSGEQLDEAAVRAWLPSPEEAIRIATFYHAFEILYTGSGHPALLCASLYGRLGAWADAQTIAEGVLALGELGMPAAFRIEAWRVLGQCRGQLDDCAGALEALQSGVAESKAPGYAWLEHLCLKDMLEWVAEEETKMLQAQIAAISAGFKV